MKIKDRDLNKGTDSHHGLQTSKWRKEPLPVIAFAMAT